MRAAGWTWTVSRAQHEVARTSCAVLLSCCLLQVFGLPSARMDVPLPVMRSVANTHNYGNEQTGGCHGELHVLPVRCDPVATAAVAIYSCSCSAGWLCCVPAAYQLLSPPNCVDLGVKEEHLHQRRSRQEMQELLAEAGIGMAEGEFDAVFRLAAGAGSVPSLDDEYSLEQLMRARQQYLRECVGL